ncbi:MAG: SUMF1/EgtB/PvdO family nonheme iron enzyme, partial [Opitutales bacterium]|nr:SUMF1/EgtB/PvdO family nonheme iron enzyme [Opitutales bacterium]
EQDPWCEIRGAGVVLEPLSPKGAAPNPSSRVAGPSGPSAASPETLWHVHIDGRRETLVRRLLEARLAAGELPPSALVWEHGMALWARLETLPELAAFLPPPSVPEPEAEATGPQPGLDWTVPDIGLELVWIKPGSFLFGGSTLDTMRDCMLHDGFWLAKSPITQIQYARVTGRNPARFRGSDQLPIESISWEEALDFCAKLSKKVLTGCTSPHGFRLPTEAQWEYACRAGSQDQFSFGDDDTQLGHHAWYAGNSKRRTHPVGSKRANPWGFHDMNGNVWEWCMDWHADLPDRPLVDWIGPSTGQDRVCRGGAWNSGTEACRSSSRQASNPKHRSPFIGFRVALSRAQ